MDKIANLVVKPFEINTSLALKYLKEHKLSEDWPSSGKCWVVNNDPDRLKYTYNLNDYVADILKVLPQPNPLTYKPGYLGRELAKIIKQNEELFCQMEYLLRGSNVVDTLNSITLLCQHLQCSAEAWIWDYRSNYPHLLMSDNSPLHMLGCAARALYVNSGKVAIAASKAIAPMCHLFVNLCAQVGWHIPIVILHNAEELVGMSAKLEDVIGVFEYDGGCTAIVTEQADVDSALDFLINSPTKVEWSLRRVFVQENVYEDFKTGLAWKCQRIEVDRCADAFTAQGKSFLCDQFHKSRSQGDTIEVPVAAYRTVKEFLSLVKQQATPYLSVWAEGSQLSHEIALAAPSDYIWLNDFASFHGPPQASLPVYDRLYRKLISPIMEGVLGQPTGKTWRKLTVDERKDVMLKAMIESNVDDDTLQDYILNWRQDSFAYVKDGEFCFAVPLAREDLLYTVESVNDYNDFIKVVNCTLCGNTVVYDRYNYDFYGVLELFENSGVPVLKNVTTVPHVDVEERVLITNKFKVIHTRFGTIFAN